MDALSQHNAAAAADTKSLPDMTMEPIQRVCVYAASSRSADAGYRKAARLLGEILGRAKVTVVYGGGSSGSMGALAEGALSAGGRVIGIMPHFMNDLEWAHRNLTELELVDDMHQRKRRMIEGVDAVVALPGGCGTLEELFEAITLKRLGLFFKPIVLVNTRGFFDDCVRLLERCVEERFMDRRHLRMWTVVARPEHVLPAIRSTEPWDPDARGFAAL
jgi:uncharacterized protein (TIGR00730 family)